MIEVLIKCPFSVWAIDDNGCEDREVEVREVDCALIEGCLNQDYNFLEDLNNYVEKGQLNTDLILPNPQPKLDEFNKPYIEIRAYSYAASLTDKDLEKITEYVCEQVSDGWGEGGFELWKNRHLEFDWKNVVHKGCKIISAEEVKKTWEAFRQLKAHAFTQIYPEYNFEAETRTWAELLNDLTETLEKLTDELHAINEKHEMDPGILQQADQLKTSIEASLND